MRKIRWMAALLAAALLLAAPASAEALTLMGLKDAESIRAWSENLFFSRMAEITGTSFTITEYTDAQAYQQAKDAAFAGGDLPDVLFQAHLTAGEEVAYARSGQLVDLAPYLQEHMPSLYAILEARPDWRAIITQPDGVIASLPVLSGAERQCCLWINRAWLDTLGLDMPQTIDEYTQVLRAFRDGDPNGNGRQDEVPLSLVSPWEAKYLLHAWGIVANDYNIYVDDGGTVRFAPLDARYREFVQWLRMATEEGLMNEDAFRSLQSTRTATVSTQETDSPLTFGGMVSMAPYTVLLDIDSTMDYAVVPPLAYEGRQVFRQLLTGVGRGAFAVTSACEDIPAVLRWADYLYTEAGGRLAYAGLEGEDYTISETGTWTWNEDEESFGMIESAGRGVVSVGTSTPGLEPAAFMRNSSIQVDTYVRRQIDTIRDTLVLPFPVTWPADEATEARIDELQRALATCVDTAIANFAMGKVELTDETWQAFEAELYALGVEEFVGLWQAVYDAQADAP